MRPVMRPVKCGGSRAQVGVAIIEWLVAAPMVILLALAGIQWALLWQARHAVEFAAQMGARAGALDHGQASAVEAGLSDGLAPFWAVDDPMTGRARLVGAKAAGWLRWQRVWPPAEAFVDFAEPALDAFGRPSGGAPEIPNDNLRFRGADPGLQSRISVVEANRLGISVTYGAALVVPLVNRIAVWLMEGVDQCRPSSVFRLGAWLLGRNEALATDRAWACAIYRAPDVPGGTPRWRWPIRVAASVRMQSTLRTSQSSPVNPSGIGRHILAASGQSGPAAMPSSVKTHNKQRESEG